jgi:hypothetical protein
VIGGEEEEKKRGYSSALARTIFFVSGNSARLDIKESVNVGEKIRKSKKIKKNKKCARAHYNPTKTEKQAANLCS